MQDEDIMAIQSAVKVQMRKYLSGVSLFDIASFDWLQKLLSSVLKAVAEAIVESWQETLLKLSKELTLECPSCGRKRAWKWRRGRKLKVSLVGLNVELPQPLVECDHCETKALNVMKILTGLSSGDSSTELELLIARRGVQDTYGRASREMKAHHGQDIERTKIRRKGLVIEQEAVEFAEQRRTRMETTSLPAKGPEKLLIEADGGSVRTGIMAPCEDGDPGYGKKTEKRGLPRRKKNIHNREMITMDIRAPGEMEPRALDVMVPVLSPPGERSRLMTTMAARAGAADNTTMRGLGDMGSGLARAFEGAFPDNKSYWAADWKHITDYVANACKVLTDFDITSWIEQMHDALWQRHKSMSDYLLSQAFGHLKLPMPEGTEKCPLHALQTYINNNWKFFRSKQMRAEGLTFISARAENQVRERIRKRFGGPGTWLEENIGPKATLMAIIDEGSFTEFTEWLHRKRANEYRKRLLDRLENAVRQSQWPKPLKHLAVNAQSDGKHVRPNPT